MGSVNYSTIDISTLRDIFEEDEPFGLNTWATCALQFNSWAKDNKRPHREYESLQKKFDKPAATKNPTGDPSCPQTVRRAKHIAASIRNACFAAVLGGEKNNEATEVDESNACVIGACEGKKRSAASGFKHGSGTPKKVDNEDALLDYVGHLMGHPGNISTTLSIGTNENGLKKEDVIEIVQANISPTNDMIVSIHDLVKDIAKK